MREDAELRARFLIIALLSVTACFSRQETSDEQAEASAMRADEIKLKAATEAIRSSIGRFTDATERFIGQTKTRAEEHARNVQLSLSNDRLAMLKKSALYEGSGAGVAARFAEEERIRNRAIGGLRRSEAVLKAGLVSLHDIAFLKRMQINTSTPDQHAHLQRLVSTSAGLITSLKPLVAAMDRLEGGNLLVGGAAAEWMVHVDDIQREVQAYNASAKRLSRPQLIFRSMLPSLAGASPFNAPTSPAARKEKDALLNKNNPAIAKVGNSPAANQDWSPSEQRMIQDWQDENERCRGGSGDDPSTAIACESRDAALVNLNAAGICYGRRGENGSQMSLHHCSASSLR